MNAKDLINYKSLSKILTKNDNGIRKNRIPKKHRESVKELEILLTYWINKNENKNTWNGIFK